MYIVPALCNAYTVQVVDTGGVMGNDKDFFSPHIHEQAMLAVKEADVILFMVDTLEGLTSEDRALASVLRKKGGDLSRSIIVLANKVGFFPPLLLRYSFLIVSRQTTLRAKS